MQVFAWLMRTTFSYISPSAWWIAAVMLAGAPASGQTRQWLAQFGTFNHDGAFALAPGQGGVFVAGETYGPLFGPLAGMGDAFLAWYTEAGVRAWGVQFGTPALDRVHDLEAAEGGGVFICGETRGSLGGASSGAEDAWVARHDALGSCTWIRQLGTGARDVARGLASDGVGGLFVAGTTEGVLAPPAPGGSDGWLARYDGKGNLLWVRQFGTAAGESVLFAATDQDGGTFLAGNTNGSFGGPFAGGSGDAWIGRFDGAGNLLWVRQLGTPSNDNVRGLSSDGSGGAVVVGSTSGSLGGPNAGNDDVWIARYDSLGRQQALAQFGSTGGDLVEGLWE